MAQTGCPSTSEPQRATSTYRLSAREGRPQVSLALDASAAVALHFADERVPFVAMEDALADGREAFTAPNFFQEVMEALRRAIREGRTTNADVQAWLSVLDSYDISPVNVNPVAACATWLIAETITVQYRKPCL